MYLRKIRCVNTGPIDDISIEFPFNSDKPIPVIIVGENGTGKSELLSFIVDSFYEFAGPAFIDVREANERNGFQYYKSITPTEIKVGKDYMYSFLEYKSLNQGDNDIGFVFKCGNMQIEDFRNHSGFYLAKNVNWETQGNYKHAYIDKTTSQEIFDRSIFCFFGPNRYEMPIWMGEKYFNSVQAEHLSLKRKWADNLGRPISAENTSKDTLSWLLDIIADSRCDVEQHGSGLQVAHVSVPDLLFFNQARRNIEQIISAILGEEVYFGLNNRGAINNRFNIRRKIDNAVLVPSLDSLSTGQIALFNLFATIIRYADWNNIGNSSSLDNITGIVVIDEIELHLHTDLQRNVLPRLLKLFPKVQFIISSHAPLFLLGMDEYFGEENYRIIEMPKGDLISSEAYSQFQNAYSYFANTRTHQEEIANAIAEKSEKALIVTEGATDWKHMKAALSRLKQAGKYTNLDICFLEYEPKNSDDNSSLKLEMGNSALRESCRGSTIVPQKRKLIFIADADDSKTTNMLSEAGLPYKTWGNNVFSLVLPVPPHRSETPSICIEHYYTDEEIKTPIMVEGTERRMFIGNEFDKYGFSSDKTLFCADRNSCGPGKINIIDGTEEKRVWKTNDENTNLALPKMKFANAVLQGADGFDSFGLSSFIPLFDVVQEIITQN
jgi:hypothetical protein